MSEKNVYMEIVMFQKAVEPHLRIQTPTLVSPGFKLHICLNNVTWSQLIYLNRAINNQITGTKGLILFEITTKIIHSITPESQANHSSYTSKILEKNACRPEWNLNLFLENIVPVNNFLNTFLGYMEAMTFAYC